MNAGLAKPKGCGRSNPNPARRASMKATFTMEYWRDGDWYVGRLREVPGVFSQGKTLAELDQNVRDAYRLVLKDQQPIRRRGVRRRALALAV